MFSLPREFRKESIKTKFCELFTSCCERLKFAVVDEENMLYKNSIIFLVYVSYYFNTKDIYNEKAFNKFGEIIYQVFYANNPKHCSQKCYFVLNANRNCLPKTSKTSFTDIDNIPKTAIEDFSKYKNAFYEFTYEPLAFKQKEEVIKI